MLFIVGEGTIALDLAKKWASFIHTISTTLLMIATIILGFFLA